MYLSHCPRCSGDLCYRDNCMRIWLKEGHKRHTVAIRPAGPMPFPFAVTGRRAVPTYETFFDMQHTPFARDLPPSELYESPAIADALGRLVYAADRQLFAVVTVDARYGKSTMVRRFTSSLPKEEISASVPVRFQTDAPLIL